jgi:hypothetical protein
LKVSRESVEKIAGVVETHVDVDETDQRSLGGSNAGVASCARPHVLVETHYSCCKLIRALGNGERINRAVVDHRHVQTSQLLEHCLKCVDIVFDGNNDVDVVGAWTTAVPRVQESLLNQRPSETFFAGLHGGPEFPAFDDGSRTPTKTKESPRRSTADELATKERCSFVNLDPRARTDR